MNALRAMASRSVFESAQLAEIEAELNELNPKHGAAFTRLSAIDAEITQAGTALNALH